MPECLSAICSTCEACGGTSGTWSGTYTGTCTRTCRTALTHLTASTAARARGVRISPRFRQGKAANHKPTQQVRGGSVPSEAFIGRHWPAIGPRWPGSALLAEIRRDHGDSQPVFELMQYTHKRSSPRRCTPHRHATATHTNTGLAQTRSEGTNNPESTLEQRPPDGPTVRLLWWH